ncbi:hypothetical protein [Nostoc sp.]
MSALSRYVIRGAGEAGEAEEDEGDEGEELITNDQCPMPHAPCPMPNAH